jgi:hypothetical protein
MSQARRLGLAAVQVARHRSAATRATILAGDASASRSAGSLQLRCMVHSAGQARGASAAVEGNEFSRW